ncbi:unnamed protein product [Zymoseptoria tritici ST99CH_3D7]|uniref:Uncharacterized protein n=1 Tax=Zymoseptoria tritici (strain ST99CH_3D7) TaxID=1276538 RepID=A0A1X7RRM3_ZYMT9|nr:unnamed protein product [Zymoseptoria tritici ST99CH_3D7]
MAGFTAINNGLRPGPAAIPPKNAPVNSESAESENTPTTIASQYLGRTNNEVAVPAKPPARKTRSQGKKRSSNERDSRTPKRQRTSSVKDCLAVTKAGAAPKSDRPAPLKPNQKKKRTSSKPTPSSTKVSTITAESEATAAKPISIYAPSTSMDALDSTSIATSYGFVKANGGSGILYQGPSSTASFSSGVENAMPLWDTHGTSRRREAPSSSAQRGSPSFDHASDTSQFQPAHLIGHDEAIVQPGEFYVSDEEFGDIESAALEELADAIEETTIVTPATPNKRERKLNMRDVEENDDYGGALMSFTDRQILDNLKKVAETTVKPIVREPFPNAILDRSPVHGASKSVVLRTCFRVGEAISAGCQSVRTGNNTIIELYARVTSSWREPAPGRKQHFVFKDLYHDRQPHLEGTFELWGQAPLWDLDSKPLLLADTQGTMCRVIARMRRDGQKWRLEVLSIWEASWEDIDFVAGIYAGSVQK